MRAKCDTSLQQQVHSAGRFEEKLQQCGDREQNTRAALVLQCTRTRTRRVRIGSGAAIELRFGLRSQMQMARRIRREEFEREVRRREHCRHVQRVAVGVRVVACVAQYRSKHLDRTEAEDRERHRVNKKQESGEHVLLPVRLAFGQRASDDREHYDHDESDGTVERHVEERERRQLEHQQCEPFRVFEDADAEDDGDEEETDAELVTVLREPVSLDSDS